MAEEKKPAKKPAPGGAGLEAVGFEAVLLLFVLFTVVVPIIGSIVFDVRVVFENQYVARFILVLKVISAIISAGALAGIVYVVRETARMQPVMTPKKDFPESDIPPPMPKDDGTFQGAWNQIKEKLMAASDSDAAYLVIEADALLDDAMKHFRIPGETMGERLEFLTGPDLKSSQDLWDAHKIRNQIAHEGAKNVLYVDALYAIEKYEKGLKELGVIS